MIYFSFYFALIAFYWIRLFFPENVFFLPCRTLIVKTPKCLYFQINVDILTFSNVVKHGKLLTQEANFRSKYTQVLIMKF